MKSKRFYRIIFYALLFAAVFILPRMLVLYTDWLWFEEIGFRQIFTTILAAKLAIGFASGALIFVLLYANVLIINRLTQNKPIMMQWEAEGTVQHVDITGHVKKFTLPILAVFGLFGGLFAGTQWQTVLQYLHQTPFNIQDPMLGRDIGFYVFSLPFIQLLVGLGFFVIFFSFLVAALLYFAKGVVFFKDRSVLQAGVFKGLNFSIGQPAKIHLSILLAFWFALTALKTYFVRIPELLYSTTGPLFGASYTDVFAMLPSLKILAFVAALAAIVILLNLRIRIRGAIIGSLAEGVKQWSAIP